MRNLYTVLGGTAHKTHETERSLGSSFGKVGKTLLIISFLVISLVSSQVRAQVSAYTFAQSAGTYTAITGTTIHAAGWDDAATSIPIGFNFVFNGTTYTTVTVNSNGYIVFGTAGLTSVYTPISTLTGSGVVSAFGRDLNAQGTAPTGLVSYSSTGGVLTIQWSDCKRYTTSTTTERFSFQIKLYQTTNVVQVVYGTFANAVLVSTVYPQVGLRGTAATDFNNRSVATGGNWAASTAGGTNTATAFYGSTSTATKPASGQTYTWTPPSCVAPVGLTASAVTLTSATLSWTAASPAPSSGYQYYYSTSATAPTGATVPTGSTAAGVTTVNLTGLTGNTLYYVWVRSNCGGSQSGWSSVMSFTTGYCTPMGLTTSTTYYLSNVVTAGGVTNISNATTAAAGGYANYSATLSCSNFIGATTNITLNQNTSTGYFYCWIDWNNDLDFADANESVFAYTTYVASYTGTISIPAGTPNGNYRMRVAQNYLGTITSCGPDTYGEYEDYTFSVVTAPSCLAPTALTSSAITSTSASISWTAASPAPASGYEYYYSTSATAPTAGTTPSGSTGAGVTTASLTGLTANTTYYFWVRSNCGGSGTSSWAGASSFFTGYCQPAGLTTSTTYFLSNVVTTGGITNISNATAASAGGYGNFSASISCSNYQGAATTIALTTSSGTNLYYCWIDWNNDLDFADANETIFATTGYTTGYTGTINIPVGTPNGNYRMRVANSWSPTITACGPSTYGEYEDYTFSVISAPSCLPPTALSSSNITPSSATISWTAPASAPASGYNYYVSTSNTAPTGATTPTGSTSAGVTSASVTGLSANTTYYYWVQSNCGTGNTSVWAGASSFFTGYCTPVATSTTTYFSNFVTTAGVSNISNVTNAISAAGYGNFTAQSVSQYPGSSVGFQATIVGGTAGIAVFIDWNNDLDFADAGETMYSSNAYQATGTTTSSFVVPAAAAVGNYRMRIVTDYNAVNPTPCSFAFGTGEAEDYTISVIALPLCSGTPSPGSTIASQTAFCTGTGSVNLSISGVFTNSGISYQWQSSADGVSYSNVSGATSATYTTPTLSSTTYYQCVVTCSAGGSATSTPVTIMFGNPSAPSATNSTSCGPGIPTGTMASTSGLTNPNLTWYTAASGGNVVLTSYTGALTSYYSNDFSSNTGIGVITGNASLTGGVVQLTPNLGSQLGALTIPASGVSADKYNVSFNLITSNVAQTGADGLSYSFGDDISGTSTTVAAETGSGTKLKVSFDDYGTSGGGISGIRVIYGATISDPGTAVGTNGVLAYNASTSWTNGNVPVIIDINNLGQLTLTVNGAAVFTNLQLPAAYLNANKSTWKHGFKARTGGVSMIHSIDNVNIQQSSYLMATSYPNNVLSTTTYYVTEANAVGCESSATPITFTVNTAPAMTLSTSAAAICPGASTSTITLTSDVANYETYSWTPSATVSGNTASGWNFTPTATTTYTLTGTNTTTQCSNVAMVTVTMNTVPPAISVSPSASTICVGNIQSLVATGGSVPTTIPNYALSSSTGAYTALTGATVSTAAVGDDAVDQNLPIGFNFTYGGTTFTNFGFNTNGIIQLGSTTINTWTNALATNTNIIAPFWDDNYVTSGTGAVSYLLSGTAPNRVLTVQWANVSIGGAGSTLNPTNNFQVKLYETSNLIQFVYGAMTSANGTSGSIGLSGGTSGSYLSVTPNATPSTSSSSENNAIAAVTNLTSGTTYTFTPPTPSTISWSPSATLFTNAAATTAYTGTSINTVYAQPTATTTYTVTATNTAGCTSSSSATLTLPTAGSALSNDAENATCIVNQNGWVHFYHSSGRLIGSINSQGQNLGAVTVTSYVDGTNALVPACANPNPIYSTSVMQRHWVITPTTQPTTPVLVRFPYSNAEFSGLTSAASTNANSNDDLLTPADLGMTKYSNGTAANVNSNPLDNCGVGTSTFHTQLGNGSATSYSAVNSNYVDFSIPGFSEFWLHGSSQASPLPVELVNFQANCAGEGKVNVTWATASEHNSANFTVEKSRDGMNWTIMASLAGAGNSTQMINYSTVDNNAGAGVNYYRLTQTDFDGASETFNIASANCGDNSPLTTVKVYPNPSAGDFYIDFTSEEIIGSSVISITDARGMEVYKMNVSVEKGSNVFHIENMEAAPGIYYIQVSNGTATSNIVKHSLR